MKKNTSRLNLAAIVMESIELSEGGPVALKICRKLQEAGFEARLVGGCVRDAVMKFPVGDIDIATDAGPDQIELLFSKVKFVGRLFGVSLVNLDGFSFEVSAYRTETSYNDFRHPSVCSWPVTLEQDASRRDFTVNAIYFAPEKPVLIDPAGGIEDIDKKLLRCVGNPYVRFAEDALRLLRAPRFAAGLDFEIEKQTERAVKKNSLLLRKLPSERISQELDKGLSLLQRRRYMELLDHLKLLEILLPEFMVLKGVKQDPDWHPEGDVYTHTLLALDQLPEKAGIELVWSTLLHDVGKISTTFEKNGRIVSYNHQKKGGIIVENLGRKLAWSKSRISKIRWLVEKHMDLLNAPLMRPGKLRCFLEHRWIEDLLELVAVDSRASGGESVEVAYCRSRISEYSDDIREKIPVSGHDLIKLGVPSGPEVGRLLEEIKLAYLEGTLPETMEEIFNFVRKLIKNGEKS